jgi:hypothetical protein
MPILTRAELAHYPGLNPTEQALAQHSEQAPLRTLRAKALSPKPLESAERGAVSLPRFLDLRPFPGRNRTERVMAWLVAHTPRAATWSEESLRELSTRIAASGKVIE